MIIFIIYLKYGEAIQLKTIKSSVYKKCAPNKIYKIPSEKAKQ